ncbi:DUF805 domain-containing protein [Flavobacterium sp. GA093]|uniref:DUF805 domain-containing protein n=1 Tax=Flavobacterium hydrocarbonoxydans TaxID=2683249 RepID=A0A6I4NLA4_9FLAO|nr:DUF805 domain-containing protein [Flavobacterium hydrocarbonoxydans]MWB93652.1 DUF805 domain-containing protein [Flavobacterium hydrocarbonoxydans]
MIEWYKKVVFENYANFKGRARRSEYWFFTLANVIINFLFIILGLIVGAIMDNILGGLIISYVLLAIYGLAVLVPSLAVIVRRLHDVGKSGWFYFIALIPIVGGIWLLVLFFTEGDSGENMYGQDPKNVIEEISEIGKVELQ